MAIEHRGGDATGFAWTLPSGLGEYWKVPNTAFVATRAAPLPREATVVLGHTRMGTGGSKSEPRNNHPVVDDGIMLIHNGTVNNEYYIYKTLFDLPLPQNTVDTAAWALLLSHREHLGATHPVEVLGVPTGSAALAWIEDNDPHALHLARTVERPLTMGWTRKGDMVMSSTPQTLEHLSLLTNIKFRRITELEEGTYLKVVHGEIVETRKFEAAKVYSNFRGRTVSQGTAGVVHDSGQGTALELVKNGGQAGVTTPRHSEQCRWDLEDYEAPKDVPPDPDSIRVWRHACECGDCLEYNIWAERDEVLKFYDTYEYKGTTYVWVEEVKMFVSEDEFFEDFAPFGELALTSSQSLSDTDR